MTQAEENRAKQEFPRLAGDRAFGKSSDFDASYNCIGFAMEDLRWFWPPPTAPVLTKAGQYWPSEISQQESVSAFIELFADKGYEICTDGTLESGFQKVAIFADPAGVPTHAARQLPDGTWTSKLGEFIDISHADPEAVGGARYGTVVVFMKRRVA